MQKIKTGPQSGASRKWLVLVLVLVTGARPILELSLATEISAFGRPPLPHRYHNAVVNFGVRKLVGDPSRSGLLMYDF